MYGGRLGEKKGNSVGMGLFGEDLARGRIVVIVVDVSFIVLHPLGICRHT